jgi:hypothetical protein
MTGNFQGWAGAIWTMGVLDVAVISYVIWMIWRLFANTSARFVRDESKRDSKPAGPWGFKARTPEASQQ